MAGRLLQGRYRGRADSTLNHIGMEQAPSILLKELFGMYTVQVPGEKQCRMIIRPSTEGGVVAIPERKDWAPSPLDLRGVDMVFLRALPGVWGHVHGGVIRWSNGSS